MEESERSSFTFYLSFEKAISKLDDNNQLIVYRAISRYSLFGEIPQVDGFAAIAWELIKPILDKSRIRSINGAKAKGKSKPNLVGNQNAVSKNGAKTKLKQSKNEAKTKRDRDKDRDRDRINIEDKSSNNGADKSTRFVPPTLTEVQDYIQKNSYSVDASTFIDFYTSKGWMVGSNKMKDWKAAVRTWQRKQKSSGNSSDIGVVLKDNSIDKYKDKGW